LISRSNVTEPVCARIGFITAFDAFFIQSQFFQYKAQLQNILNTAVSYIPNPGKHDPVAALEAKMGSMRMSTLTLENWRDTLTEHVTPKTTVPDEWWVLISGRNKTCFGNCHFYFALRLRATAQC